MGTEMTAAVRSNENDALRRAWRGVDVDPDALDPSLLQPLSYTKFELNNLKAIAGSGATVARGFEASRDVLGGRSFGGW